MIGVDDDQKDTTVLHRESSFKRLSVFAVRQRVTVLASFHTGVDTSILKEPYCPDLIALLFILVSLQTALAYFYLVTKRLQVFF